MFDICLLPSSQLGPDGQRLGRITIGDFTERFACHPVIASVEEYPRIWKEKLRLLIDGQSSVALVHDPRFAWIIYRDGESCHVQQHLALNGFSARFHHAKLPVKMATRSVNGILALSPLPGSWRPNHRLQLTGDARDIEWCCRFGACSPRAAGN